MTDLGVDALKGVDVSPPYKLSELPNAVISALFPYARACARGDRGRDLRWRAPGASGVALPAGSSRTRRARQSQEVRSPQLAGGADAQAIHKCRGRVKCEQVPKKPKQKNRSSAPTPVGSIASHSTSQPGKTAMSHMPPEYSPEAAKSTNVCFDTVIQGIFIMRPNGKRTNAQICVCEPPPTSAEEKTGSFWENFNDELAKIFGSRAKTDQPPISLTLIEAYRPKVLSKSFGLRGDGTLEKRAADNSKKVARAGSNSQRRRNSLPSWSVSNRCRR